MVTLSIFHFINKIINYFKEKNKEIYKVTLEDKYAEYALDGDEIDDPILLVDVVYDSLGNIIKTSPSNSEKESHFNLQQHFSSTCNINLRGGVNEYKKFTAIKL